MRWMIFLAAILLFGCATPEPATIQSKIAQLQKDIKGIRVDDGIDAHEAEIISQSYFWRFAGTGCGGVAPPKETGDNWIAQVYIGYGEGPAGNIIIEKHTGKVSWEGGPTVDEPRNMWE
jgi:hypothetical protein